jgi:hypothetical protein
MKMHDGQMASLAGIKDLVAKIDETVANHEALAQKYAKHVAGHNADDLTAAKEKLLAVQSQMDTWMQGFKKYDEEAKHEEVMAQLTKYKDELTGMQGTIDEAMSAAKTALDSHAQFAADLMAKVKPRGR